MSVTWKKRILSALVSGAMMASLVPAPALADPDPSNASGAQATAAVLDSTAATAGPGYSLTVSGLEAGDNVTYYRIVEQDVDTTKPPKKGTQQWRLSKIVDADGDGMVDGTESSDFGHKDKSGGASTVNGLFVDEMVVDSFSVDANDTVSSDTRQLTPAMVNAIAAAVTNNLKNNVASATGTGAVALGQRSYTVAGAESGLYMFVAVPAQNNGTEPDYIYKPIFVSADYYNAISKPEDSTHAIALENGTAPKTYADYPAASGQDENAGVFKKSPLTVDKHAGKKDAEGNYTDLQTDVAVGDTIDFTITVPVPTYTKNYVAPQFYVTDTLTSGLKLVEGSISVTVKNGENPVECVKDQDFYVYTDGDDIVNFEGMTKDTEGFVVQFLNDNPKTTDVRQDGFLYSVVNAPVATITYQAEVKTEAGANFAQQVNQMDNTAKLIYSRDPSFIPDGYYKTVEKDVPVIDPDTGEQATDPSTGDPITEKKNVNVPDDTFDSDDPTNKVRKTDPNDDDSPVESEQTGKLEDKTRHYTFDIDADVLGRDQSGDKVPGDDGQPTEEDLPESEHDKTSELRKVWIDANGTEIAQDKLTSAISKNGGEGNEGAEYDGKDGVYGWLKGAEFSLRQTKTHTVTEAGTGTFTAESTPKEIKFDSTTHVRVTSGGQNPTSDARGYIPMKGLDAGEYELTEVRAPLGYAFNPNIKYTITITPTYVSEAADPDNGKGGGDDLILASYEVKITTSKLDENLNAIEDETVETVCIYNLRQDANKNPYSLLKEDGTSNTEPTVTPGATQQDPATITPAEAGIDATVTTFGDNEAAVIYNQKLGILPATGGSGLLFYLIVGGAVAGISLVLMKRVKKASTMV